MVVEVEITEDLLKVLPLMKIVHQEVEHTNGTDSYMQTVLGVDSDDLFLSTDIIEDMAFALNIAVQNEPDENGLRRYDDWVVKKLESLATYIKENLYYIFTLMIQFSAEGLKAGIYQALDNELIWKKIN